MGKTRRRFSKEFKAQVAIEALKEQKVLTQISIDYGVHPNQITLWEKELTEKASEIKISWQCELLGVSRLSFYSALSCISNVKIGDEELVKRIDKIYTDP